MVGPPTPPPSQRSIGDAAQDARAAAARAVGGAARGWRALIRWLRANTFSPSWLAPPWRHPLTGYVVALFIQGLAFLLTLLLVLAYHDFPFPGVLSLLGIVLVALSFGAGPSLFATAVAAVLVDGVVVPRNSAWPLASAQNAIAVALVVGAGAIVSVVASTAERARRIAEAATRDRDTFLILAAHELNTPVMLVRGNAQLLRRRFARLASTTTPKTDDTGRLIAEVRPVVARIEAAGERMGRLIEEMLAFTAIQAGRLEFHLTPCALGSIVTAAVGEQRLLHPERRILLEVPDAPLVILADADRIEQVVAQFVGNALKYAPEDRPVTVGLEAHGDQARVSVRDEGPGLAPEEQARVWQAFYRAPGIEVQSESSIGMGLGLYLGRTIVERHGGRTGVDSKPGHGATFWFTLPLAPAADDHRDM